MASDENGFIGNVTKINHLVSISDLIESEKKGLAGEQIDRDI